MTDGGAEDLRGLQPPRPLEITLERVAALAPGGVFHAVYFHEPGPLYALLPARGVAWRSKAVTPDEVHVVFWRAGDEAAERLARAAVP